VLTSQSRLSKIIRDFQTGETDCLIGTQMLAKGHDFPKVTLGAILHLEDALFLPDFRASEKTFQLLTQAIGRASRAGGTGTVVLQSLVVGHPVITKSLDEKVTEFMKKELSLRQLAFHPPYCRQILFEFRHKKKEIAMERASTFKNTLIDFWQTKGISQKKLRIAGPYFAILERLQEQFRVQICIHAEKSFHPSFLIPKEILFSKQFQSSLRIDVDPFSFL
jgi:primosomal protein N' (replication factor Y)